MIYWIIFVITLMILQVVLTANLSAFTRVLDNPYDDKVPDGVKGSSAILLDNGGAPDVLEFSEDGYLKYPISIPKFDDDNKDITGNMTPRYEFKPLDTRGPYKPQNFTYRSDVKQIYLQNHDIENAFMTITWNASWETWELDKDRVHRAIMRETTPMIPIWNPQVYRDMQYVFLEWYEGMCGNIKQDVNYVNNVPDAERKKKDAEDKDDEEDDD